MKLSRKQENVNFEQLKKIARNIRINSFTMLSNVRASHLGSSLSCADILAVLYGKIMNIKRDVFILSKGHAIAAQYCAMEQVGIISSAELDNAFKDDSLMWGCGSHKFSGIKVSTGSLGHGLGMGVGIAQAYKMNNKKNKVFVVLGDGECDEGSVWEAVMLAARLELDNLTIIVDKNDAQASDKRCNILNLNLYNIFKAFGCAVEDCDGHNLEALVAAFFKTAEKCPKVIIAQTIKGKGVSFLENVNIIPGGLTGADIAAGKEELLK